jgi:hypothetical protein
MPTTSPEGIFPPFKTIAVFVAIVFIALFAIVPFAIVLLTATGASAQQAGAGAEVASPIFGVTIPPGYPQQQGYALILLSIEPAEEDDEGDDCNWNRGVPRYGR